MSFASKTYVIANGNPNDGGQVETNFLDLINFMNGSMPHSDGTGGAADIRGVIGAGGTTGLKLKAGTTAYSIVAAAGVSITITYGFTFATLIALVASVKSDSNIPLITYLNGAPTLSSAGARVETKGGGNTTNAGDVHWIAIGT